MTVAAIKSESILRTAAGEPPLGYNGESFRDDQGEIICHDNPRYAAAARIGALQLDTGDWLIWRRGKGFPIVPDGMRYATREDALEDACDNLIEAALHYMRAKPGEGTQWSEEFGNAVVGWAQKQRPRRPAEGADDDDPRRAALIAISRGEEVDREMVRGLVGEGLVHCTTTRLIVTEEGRAFLAAAPEHTKTYENVEKGSIDAITDPIVKALCEAHRARIAYPAGHTFAMTNPIVNGAMVTMGTCSCGDSFSYSWGGYERMDAAIEAHWQKFDHLPDKVDGRGNPVTDIADDAPHISRSEPAPTSPPIDGAGSPLSPQEAGGQSPASEPAPSPSSPAGAGEIERAQICASSHGSVDDLGSVQDALKMSSDGPSSPGTSRVAANAPADGVFAFNDALGEPPAEFWESPLIRMAQALAWREEDDDSDLSETESDDHALPSLPAPSADDLKALSSANVTILVGDCRALLKTLPGNSVHCVVTSPPYWGLRDYGIEPTIWGGDEACTHEWGTAVRAANANNVPGPNGLDGKNANGHRNTNKEAGNFCAHCGAWRGAFGLEPTYDMFVDHAVEVFREVRRVLRPDGTLWLNIGDSYATGAGRVGKAPGGGDQGEQWRGGHEGKHGASWFDRPALGENSMFADRKVSGIGPMTQPNRLPQAGLKAKDLVGIPWRVAFALQADGWWLRQDIIWSKPNPMPESIRDRCTKAHEYIFLLSKSERYYYDQQAILEEVSPNTRDRLSQDVQNQVGSDRAVGKTNGNMKAVSRKLADAGSGVKNNDSFDAAMAIMPPKRNKRSVWEVATQPFKEAHFATFPPDLIIPCIVAGCPEGGTVLDPFGGAGTTGLVADRLRRRAMLLELNPAYAAMASRRIKNDAGILASVEVKAQTDEAPALFNLAAFDAAASPPSDEMTEAPSE